MMLKNKSIDQLVNDFGRVNQLVAEGVDNSVSGIKYTFKELVGPEKWQDISVSLRRHYGEVFSYMVSKGQFEMKQVYEERSGSKLYVAI